MPPAPGIWNTEGVANIIGWAGTIGSLALFGSPVPTFVKISKDRTTGDFAILPYAAGMLNTASWVSYSIVTPDRYQTAVTNGFGAAIMVLWLVLYTKYSPARGAALAKIAVVFLVWAAMTFLAVFVITDEWFTPLRHGESCKTEFVGICCIAFNILMYGSPLGAVKQVIKSRSVASMPLPLSLAALISSILWAAYATLLHDAWVGLPNYIGTFLGVIQIGIYSMYCRHRQAGEQRLVEDPSTSMQPSCSA
mmetsp:Transcript_53103/g.116263  ORF Transcript_53103/g.116263 Transcript_53103/m.116263 type:complete len:250 (+) Transcript_53103:113-862(+)